MKKISKYFYDYELISPTLLAEINKNNADTIWYISQDKIQYLDDLREYLGTPIIANTKVFPHRGICTNEENINQKRTLTSLHNFNAVDLTFGGLDILENAYTWTLLNAPKYNIGAIGINRARNFIHIDWRNCSPVMELKY